MGGLAGENKQRNGLIHVLVLLIFFLSDLNFSVAVNLDEQKTFLVVLIFSC